MAEDTEQPNPLPLGVGAYSRTYGKMPEIKLVNRFFEENPTNAVDGAALLSRPGSNALTGFGEGPHPRHLHSGRHFRRIGVCRVKKLAVSLHEGRRQNDNSGFY